MLTNSGDGGDVLPIAADADVVQVRQRARLLAVNAGLSLVDQTKLITAASELARNTLVHGGGGYAVVRTIEQGGRRGVCAEFVDEGPGIADLERAMQDGWTSGSGLGLGLPGSRRLVDLFELESDAGKGTRVTIVKWGR
jgi:serine/threonine-protein kinase RsbT